MQTSEYQAHAERLLSTFGVTFSVTLVGDNCPMFCEDKRKDRGMDELNKWPRKTHIHGKQYRVTFARSKQTMTIDFWNSYQDEFHNWAIGQRPFLHSISNYSYQLEDMIKAERKKSLKRIEPNAYDVLACITKSYPGTFADFCGDFGYDEDSRQAEKVYHAVMEEWGKVAGFFKSEELEQLQEVA